MNRTIASLVLCAILSISLPLLADEIVVNAVGDIMLAGEAEQLPLDILHRRVGFQEQLLAGERSAVVIRQLNILSKPFNTEIQSKDGRYLVFF